MVYKDITGRLIPEIVLYDQILRKKYLELILEKPEKHRDAREINEFRLVAIKSA
ncbi:MAG: hypothetical protein ABH883_09765 [Candidatus Omnitrophota bacterium]